MEKFEIKLPNKLDRSQSLFYFVPHIQAGSTTNKQQQAEYF